MKNYIGLLLSALLLSSGCLFKNTHCEDNPTDPACAWNRDAGALDASMDATIDAAVDAARDFGPDAPPPCDGGVRNDAGVCVECTSEMQCVGNADRPFCGAEGRCVECLTSNDCDANAPVCTAGVCGGCTARTDCDRFATDPSPTPACHESGECRQCDPGAETSTTAGDCGAKSCDPATWACTGTDRGALGLCRACVNDSECSVSSGTRRCVATNYRGTTYGSYCLLDKSSVGDVCPPRFASSRTTTSVSGTSATYCVPRDTATCEAILEFLTSCPSGGETLCGDDTITDDGFCRDDGDGSFCTHRCTNTSDCSDGYTCLTDEITPYCRTTSGT